MNFVITGTENIPTYLAIIGFTFVFSFLFWKTLFYELDVFEVKYTKKNKKEIVVANFFKSALTHNMVEIITAVAITTAIIVPPPAYAAKANMNLKKWGQAGHSDI